jgi:hypothetical protein
MLLEQLRAGHAGVNLSDCSRCRKAALVSTDDELRGKHLIVEAQHGLCDEIRIESDEQYIEATMYLDVRVLSYRLDFVIEINSKYLLAIECDGHDFHDRTKQQAAYDRSRDRELLKIGIVTARFTGSEIHHSPSRCASDIWQIV